jgi:hypothetical protein
VEPPITTVIGIIRLSSATLVGAAVLLTAGSSTPYPQSTPPHGGSRGIRAARLHELPPTILWAWDRPEDLSFIDPSRTAVAFLAETIYLRGEEVGVRPRLQTLRVPNTTRVIAVVRTEIDRRSSPSLSAPQREMAVSAIASLGRRYPEAFLQVDFDATLSQRAFYREILRDLARTLPATTPLSITALASWCLGDDWVSDLPVQETIPMLFRMGPDRVAVLDHLQSGREFQSPLCRSSAGVSLDEPLSRLPAMERVYVFNPAPWSSDDYLRAAEIGGFR